MKKIFLLIFLVPFFLLSCLEDEKEPILYLSNFKIKDTVFLLQNEKEFVALMPQETDLTSLVPTFQSNGIVTVKRKVQESGVSVQDFSSPVVYMVSSPQTRKIRYYTIRLSNFTGLPKLYISTENNQAINSKENYVKASFSLDPNSKFDCGIFSGTGKIRGRGNSTWGMAKKPYKIKFDNPVKILGLPAQKEWVLLANYADKSLIRTTLAFELSKRLNMKFTPSSRFVEVFLNGSHLGNYMITDQLEIGENRVDIKKLHSADVDEQTITGGYLLEIDYRSKTEEGAIWFESRGMPIAIKEPENITAQQLDYIKEYVQNADNILYGSNYKDPENGFRKYFDETSFIDWFLVNELFKNCDASGFSSIFFYKDRGDSKLYMGPVWDFDLGAGNARHAPACQITSGWWIKTSKRFDRMFADPVFNAKVKQTWKENKTKIREVIDLIDPLTMELDLSRKKNFILWPNFEDPDYFVIPGNRTYEMQIMYLKDFLERRYLWLDQEFSKP